MSFDQLKNSWITTLIDENKLKCFFFLFVFNVPQRRYRLATSLNEDSLDHNWHSAMIYNRTVALHRIYCQMPSRTNLYKNLDHNTTTKQRIISNENYLTLIKSITVDWSWSTCFDNVSFGYCSMIFIALFLNERSNWNKKKLNNFLINDFDSNWPPFVLLKLQLWEKFPRSELCLTDTNTKSKKKIFVRFKNLHTIVLFSHLQCTKM